MAKSIPSLLFVMAFLLLPVGCGEEEQQYWPCPWARDEDPGSRGQAGGMDLCCPDDSSPEERAALEDLSCALDALELKQMTRCFDFPRSMDEEMPRVCQGCKCADAWGEIPGLFDVPPSTQYGYQGYCGWHVVMVRRFGDLAPDQPMADQKMRNLLAHEYGHVLGLDHGPEMQAITASIKKVMSKCKLET